MGGKYKMNNELFQQLQKKQDELDQFIYEKKGIKNPEKLLPETAIALQVEFNELINELPRLFKYWSSKPNNLENAIEEYIDCLHFLLKLSNMLEIKEYNYERPTKEYDLRNLIIGINNMISRVILDRQFEKLMNHFLLFGEKCSFTMDEIVKEYNRKYIVNIERQEQGY